jgi:hypothetical protein
MKIKYKSFGINKTFVSKEVPIVRKNKTSFFSELNQ